MIHYLNLVSEVRIFVNFQYDGAGTFRNAKLDQTCRNTDHVVGLELPHRGKAVVRRGV